MHRSLFFFGFNGEKKEWGMIPMCVNGRPGWAAVWKGWKKQQRVCAKWSVMLLRKAKSLVYTSTQKYSHQSFSFFQKQICSLRGVLKTMTFSDLKRGLHVNKRQKRSIQLVSGDICLCVDVSPLRSNSFNSFKPLTVYFSGVGHWTAFNWESSCVIK